MKSTYQRKMRNPRFRRAFKALKEAQEKVKVKKKKKSQRVSIVVRYLGDSCRIIKVLSNPTSAKLMAEGLNKYQPDGIITHHVVTKTVHR